MAKRIFLIRHAEQAMQTGYDVWDFGSPILPHAMSQIEKAARYFKESGFRFSAYWHSALVRSAQTSFLLAELMGERERKPRIKEELGPGEPEMWNWLYNTWKLHQEEDKTSDIGTPEILQMWPDICEREGTRILSAVRTIASGLADGENAAAVSHNPLIRLGQYMATGFPKPDLTHCQAICFTLEDGWLDCEDHLLR